VTGGGPLGGGPVGESLEALEAAEASASIGGDNRSGEALRPVLQVITLPVAEIGSGVLRCGPRLEGVHMRDCARSESAKETDEE